MPDIEQQWRKLQKLQVEDIVRALLNEFGALTDYRVLRDSLPRRLATLLRCRCVLLYQHIGATLQLVAGSFDDEPGWSASLLAVAHINPINASSDGPEARAWRERHMIIEPEAHPILVALPLTYRHRGMGILVALRGDTEKQADYAVTWAAEEVHGLDVVADIVALLLENTRLLERDRERIHELSLLNSIGNQLNGALYERERLKGIIIQRAQEVSLADLCVLLEPSQPETLTTWITPAFQQVLVQHFREQQAPLIIERPGAGNDLRIATYLQHLPLEVKTFFAIPLLDSQERERQKRSAAGTVAAVPGILVGAYHHLKKLRREEMVLLQVLANQASAVLKNIQLMAELVEARNEARKLLRQVLDDQSLKELILASIPSGLITTDLNGHIVTFNQAASAILGYQASEVLGQPLQQFLHMHIIPFLKYTEKKQEMAGQSDCTEGMEKLRQVQSETVIMLNQRGEEVILDVDVLPLWGDPGERIGLLITFVDMTSMHRLEEEKRRLDRLAVLGEMSANVAHEVRNPLASIKTAMQMLAGELIGTQENCVGASPCVRPRVLQEENLPGHGHTQGDAPTQFLQKDVDPNNVQEWALASIDVVLKEVERLDSIVRELLQFARPRQLHRSICSIGELSDRVLHLLQRQCSEANIIVQRVYASVPALQIDVGQIEQVLLNLYMNALQAMPDGGSLTIACHLTPKARSNRDDQWLELTVSDTGPGIAPGQAERIFQPFFTTKAHGIGLGLAITRRLVEDHGGYICVEEGQPGYGATFSVRLPLLVALHESEEENYVEGS